MLYTAYYEQKHINSPEPYHEPSYIVGGACPENRTHDLWIQSPVIWSIHESDHPCLEAVTGLSRYHRCSAPPPRVFKILKTIADSANCEVCSVIHILNTRSAKLVEIYRQLVDIYGENIMTEEVVSSYTEALDDRPLTFKPWSCDEDDT
ncbi:hypothetical protein TNCV_3655321 [Trichonephila clavipes]|nr:hypothetical protein TNCV_3655321 [Trichonephila clavipes]